MIVTFLALLELMKLNQFVVRQNELLGDIVIERRGVNAVAALEAAEIGADERLNTCRPPAAQPIRNTIRALVRS